MGNNLNTNLVGRFVIFDAIDPTLGTPAEWPYLVLGGFGASAAAAGRKLFGEWVRDGDTAGWMPGDAVARFATDEEIRAAIRQRMHATGGLPGWLDPDLWAANEHIGMLPGKPA